MPLDARAVAAGLYEGLVVPESYWSALEQLARGQGDCVVIHKTVERTREAPVAQAVEQDLAAAGGLVVVELVKKVTLWVRWILSRELVEIAAQHLELRGGAEWQLGGDEAVAVELLDLLMTEREGTQHVGIAFERIGRRAREVCEVARKVALHRAAVLV